MVVWKSDWKVGDDEETLQLLRGLFLNDGWLHGYLHSENNKCLSTKNTNANAEGVRVKKGVRFCVRVRCTCLVYTTL